MLRKTVATLAMMILSVYTASAYASGGDRIAFTNKMGFPINLDTILTTPGCDAAHNTYPHKMPLAPGDTELFFMHAQSLAQCGVSLLVTSSAISYLSGGTVSFDTDESGHFFSLTKRGWNYLYTSGITAAGPFIDKSHKSYWVYNIKLYQSL